ncbi:MAG: MBL fold metallo-hydrolase [Actinobacteria bacterium]|nr:MBL fold metallo-hydrolase [Actinomycetota bacterium]
MPRTKLKAADPGVEEPLPPEKLTPFVAKALSPLVRRIVAPNAGIYTGPGTNTYLVGIDEVVVVDPAVPDAEHLDAIMGCGGDRIRWIAVTHTHPDHATGVAELKKLTDAEVLGFGAKDGFKPDRRIGDGYTIDSTEFRLRAVHTPGHASNHLCYLVEEERMLLSGDHINQSATVVIRPPDGNMATYLASLEKLKKLRLRSIAPGHGTLIENPSETIDWYVRHRLDREKQVLAALRRKGTAKIADLVPVIYADIDEERWPIARYTVHAHLVKLAKEGKVTGKTLAGKWSAA